MSKLSCATCALATALGLAACGHASTTTDPTPSVETAPRPAKHAAPPRRPRKAVKAPSGLAYSTAAAQNVQAQPAPGSCHAIGRGSYSRPDPACSPGALNPGVTQANIHETICQSGWTSTVRPPEQVTEAEKAQSMAAYGDGGGMSDYEYDHLIPLELGGAVNDRRNLWPEPGASPNPKDAVEYDLNQKVCDGQLTLAQAQRAIAGNWVKLTTSAPTPAGSTTGNAHCSATASYSNRYRDFDVYVHSNQPAQTVTVTDSSGRSASWHAGASGYADVYFKAPASASNETVHVHVGSASCQTAL